MGQHILELLLDNEDVLARLRKPAKTKAELNEVNRERVARHRAKRAAAKDSGVVEPSKENVREALADAALMMLAVGSPGAEQVRAVLRKVFAHHPGTPMTVEAHARGGQLRPKLLKLK